LYLYSGRKCATRFSYPQEWSSLVKENYVKDAEKALPELIIQESVSYFGEGFDMDTLLNKKYQLIQTIDNTEIWKLKE